MKPFGRNGYAPKIGWGLCPFGRGGAEYPSNTMWPGPRPTCMHAKFHLDPSNPLATVHERYRQTGQTDNGPIA